MPRRCFEAPKAFDGTLQEEANYLERGQQIGNKLLYAFNFVPEVGISLEKEDVLMQRIPYFSYIGC